MKFSAIINSRLQHFLFAMLVGGLYLACSGDSEQTKPEESRARQELQAKIVYYALPG